MDNCFGILGYNMVDNVLNNGAGEKTQKEENRKAQDKPAANPSLKARLAEKKAQAAGHGDIVYVPANCWRKALEALERT